MITHFIDKINKYFIFEFYGKDINAFINHFAETNETSMLINLLVSNYFNDSKRNACKCLLESHQHYDDIINAVDKMMNNEIVLYKKEYINIDDTNYHYLMSLYINQ